MLTLSPPADVAARIHDLHVVSDRTTARRARLLALSPAPDVWAGPAAAAFTQGRLRAAAAGLLSLSDGLTAMASLLGGVLAELPAVGVRKVGEGGEGAPAALVRRVQRELGVPADGVWGPVTALSVRRFQARSGLAVTGGVDAATASALAAFAAGGAVRLGGPALWSLLAPRTTRTTRTTRTPRMTLDGVSVLAGRPPLRSPGPLSALDPASSGTANGGTADGGTDAPAAAGTEAADPVTADSPSAASLPADSPAPATVAPLPYVGLAQAPVAPSGMVTTDGYDPSDPNSDPGPGDPQPIDPDPVDPMDPGPLDSGPDATP